MKILINETSKRTTTQKKLSDFIPTTIAKAVPIIKIEKGELYECYYCHDFKATNKQIAYECHVISEHPGKPCFPRNVELKEFGLTVKGKSWESWKDKGAIKRWFAKYDLVPFDE